MSSFLIAIRYNFPSSKFNEKTLKRAYNNINTLNEKNLRDSYTANN